MRRPGTHRPRPRRGPASAPVPEIVHPLAERRRLALQLADVAPKPKISADTLGERPSGRCVGSGSFMRSRSDAAQLVPAFGGRRTEGEFCTSTTSRREHREPCFSTIASTPRESIACQRAPPFRPKRRRDQRPRRLLLTSKRSHRDPRTTCSLLSKSDARSAATPTPARRGRGGARVRLLASSRCGEGASA